jgi:hypothetical protein
MARKKWAELFTTRRDLLVVTLGESAVTLRAPCVASPLPGEGEGEGRSNRVVPPPAKVEPLTSVLSPAQGER